MAAKIFLSYRRAEHEDAIGRLRDRLEKDKLFWDVRSILGGADFAEDIREQLSSCAVLLAVIGPQWLAALDRLADAKDAVRNEIAQALAQPHTTVIPVLVGGAELPEPDSLPEELRAMLAYNAVRLDSESYDQGIAHLGAGIEQALKRDSITASELDDYRARARDKYGSLPVLGFKSARRIDAKFEELVVTLRTEANPSSRGAGVFSKSQRAEEEGAGRRGAELRTLAEAFGYAKDKDKRGLMLLGDPGTGKTTFLLQTLLAVLDDPGKLGLSPRTVPVFLPLRELRDKELELGAFIQSQLPGREAYAEDFGARLAERGELLLLFDGLDELADVSQRKSVSRWLEDLLVARKDSYILASCRYAGYLRKVELDRFIELNIHSLSDEQMRSLVSKLYRLIEQSELVGPGEGAAKSEALLEILAGPRFQGTQMYEMVHNPLLLTGICWVHWQRDELRHARAELYEQCVEVFRHRWEERCEDQCVEFPLGDEDHFEEALRPMASWMHGGRKRRAHRDELEQPLADALEDLDVDIKARDFLAGVRDDAGLLSGFGKKEFEFVHLGFQEYLTARQHLDDKRYTELAAHVGDSWWQEVTLLTLGREARAFEPFMRALTQRADFDFTKWSESEWMDLCLEEAKKPTAAPFEALLREGGGRHALAAAKLVARLRAGEDEALDELLGQHPVAEVRAWWGRQRGGPALETREVHGVELVRIPAGRFWMGSPEGVGHDDERPRHEVELTSFWLARTPVTNEQYRRYLEANPGAAKPEYWGDRRYNQSSQPVVGVSWHDAQAYCEWAGLVLPTEAQWEVACRAGTETKYWSGDDEQDLDRVGWYVGNSGQRLHPVGQKEANAFGLHDVHGNVWEWCLDGLTDDYEFESYTTSPRVGDGLRREPGADGVRVVRGGGWGRDADNARSAYRYDVDAGDHIIGIGFRPAQGIP